MAYNSFAVFIETSHFTKLVYEYLTDNDYQELQEYLMQHPEAGNLIRGSGGLRKLRWSRVGLGKSSGVRIIYYWVKIPYEIYMLTIYSKSEKNNLDKKTLAQIAKQLGGMK